MCFQSDCLHKADSMRNQNVYFEKYVNLNLNAKNGDI